MHKDLLMFFTTGRSLIRVVLPGALVLLLSAIAAHAVLNGSNVVEANKLLLSLKAEPQKARGARIISMD